MPSHPEDRLGIRGELDPACVTDGTALLTDWNA
jgi:hypothetical protein